MTNRIQTIIKDALEEKAFPGGVLIASKQGETVVREPFGCIDYTSGLPVRMSTFYDLASLTKPLATTLAVIHLVNAAKLHLDQTLGELLPDSRGTDKVPVTVKHLLTHCSGLPDYRPYFRALSGETAVARDRSLGRKLLKEPLVSPVGSKTVYSDLGFMLLRRVVERTAGTGLDRLVKQNIYDPMGIGDLFFPGVKGPGPADDFAPTEWCLWRKKLICGEVHDENAHAVGGVDGHAGLFGTAPAVHTLLLALMAAYNDGGRSPVIPGEAVRKFLEYGRDGRRALGFDRPSRVGSSSGRFFSPDSVGHLGFTGTSFWMDLDRGIIVVLLTNRVHPTRENEKIKVFRPLIHDAVMTLLI